MQHAKENTKQIFDINSKAAKTFEQNTREVTKAAQDSFKDSMHLLAAPVVVVAIIQIPWNNIINNNLYISKLIKKKHYPYFFI